MPAQGAADRLDLLQLKVSQLSTSLSGLNTSHGELADKLAVLNRWKAEQQAVVGGAASTAAGTASVLSASSGARHAMGWFDHTDAASINQRC